MSNGTECTRPYQLSFILRNLIYMCYVIVVLYDNLHILYHNLLSRVTQLLQEAGLGYSFLGYSFFCEHVAGFTCTMCWPTNAGKYNLFIDRERRASVKIHSSTI